MSLRILFVMDPLIPVPPEHYGGIERVIADIADDFSRRGHDVSLWAAPGSHITGRTEPFGRTGEWTRWSNLRNTALLTGRFLARRGTYDVIHNFGRLAYLASTFRNTVAKVQTYMRTVNPGNMRIARRLGAQRLRYTAVSDAIRRTGAPGGGDWSVVYNCAPVAQLTPVYDVDAARAPLVFLGRLERCKGAHTAIAVARRLGRELVIAGNISPLPEEREYFEREVLPLVDGVLVRWIGPVNNAEKNELLGRAAALLLPVEWEEPFPVVLPEALLCGTPVIALRRGGIPEGIDDGRTGFVCDDLDGLAASVEKLPQIDRRTCRATAEQRFSGSVIAGEYERIYRELLES